MHGKPGSQGSQDVSSSPDISSTSDRPPSSRKGLRSKANRSAATKRPNGKVTNGKVQKKSLGPVSNLEELVPQEWWSHIFNALYLKTDGDVVEDQNITRQEIDAFSQILKLSPDDTVLDLCCGQGRHTIELVRRGFTKAQGLDRSRYLIGKAKERAKSENLKISFREGDARKLPYRDDTFDVVVILGNSFGYFEAMDDDLKVLHAIAKVLKPEGRLLLDVTDGGYLKTHFQPRSWEWIGKKEFVCRERCLSKNGNRLISREIITDTEKGVVKDQFYAERLYTKENISEILKNAGFGGITFHGTISPDSQRNQDLGMMEQRLIVTGFLIKK